MGGGVVELAPKTGARRRSGRREGRTHDVPAGVEVVRVHQTCRRTDSCQARHIGTGVSGQLHVRHDDGTEADVTPGAAYLIEPGHDAWVVSDEPFVGYEFESTAASTYATS
jgi:hypothetical protein